MKPAITLMAVFFAACAGSRPSPSSASTTPASLADSCAVARPDFGGVATEADRKLFAYDVNAPLNLDLNVESLINGVAVSTISFDSPNGGSATGMFFDPILRSGPRPGIVLMMGTTSARGMAGQGRVLAAHGAVVIAIDAPFARRGSPLLRFTPQDRAEQIRLIRDLQRAVDVLRARANVDTTRIAYVGMSYGGAMGALFVGIERRLKAAVLEAADGGMVTHETGPDDVTLARLSCAARVTWLRAMAPIEPIRFIPHASPTPLLLQNGRSDKAVPVADAEALHNAAPDPKSIRWYNAGHSLNLQAVTVRHAWLNEQIGLDQLRR